MKVSFLNAICLLTQLFSAFRLMKSRLLNTFKKLHLKGLSKLIEIKLYYGT